jgi:hypothetical protein
MKRILVDGFNDIVDIIWGEEGPTMIVKSNVEKICRDMSKQSEIIVILWIEIVEKDRDKQYFIEPMMPEEYNGFFLVIHYTLKKQKKHIYGTTTN